MSLKAYIPTLNTAVCHLKFLVPSVKYISQTYEKYWIPPWSIMSECAIISAFEVIQHYAFIFLAYNLFWR